jgi:type I restriction enzyme S subunit
VESLLACGALIGHQDGNHGSQYPRVSEFGEIGVPFLTAKLIQDGRIEIACAPRLAVARAAELRIGFARPGDVLLSHNATIGRIAIVPPYEGPILLGTSLTYFRVDPEQLSAKYLAAFMAGRAFQSQLAAVMSHTTRNQVPISAQRQLRIVVPPLAYQEEIADTLDALERKIDLNRRMGETADEMARALFKSWFIDFDPVRAKMEGRRPYGMDTTTAALFPESFQDSLVGPIPRGWSVEPVSKYAALNPEVWTRSNAPLSISYVDLAAVKWGRIASPTRLLFAEAPSRARRILKEGDTIIGTVRPANGSYGHISRTAQDLTGSTGFAVLRPHQVQWRAFIYLLLTRRDFIEYLGSVADGSAYPAVDPGIIHSTLFAAPAQKIVHCFDGAVRDMIALIAARQGESETLAQLRDTLVPKLLSGEIRVLKAEEMVEAS